MNPAPWNAPDFDLRNVIAADESQAFRDSMTAALEAMQVRLLTRPSVLRRGQDRRQIDLMCGAIACAHEVLDAAYAARK